MSGIEATVARIAEIQQLTNPDARRQAATGGVAAPPSSAFAAQLASAAGVAGPAQAGQAAPTAFPGLAGGGTAGARVVAAAAGEVGVTEQPMGSNDSPRIAEYRSAMPGNPGVGPWCAYFTSWVGQQAGVPLGEQGQGFASVDALYAWAQRTGRALPNGSVAPVRPQPGDLIVWDEHIGVVESVAADGTVHTIEGNSSDMVTRRTHAPGSALGYVRLG